MLLVKGKVMKWKLMILPALLLPVLAAAAPKLVENGRSDYAIVLPQSAILPEETAAKELQSMLKRISGAELPIVRDETYAGKAILLGRSDRTAQLLGVDFRELRPDEILLKQCGDDLVLSGDRPRGTLYAVYEFLEELGVRRWTFRDEEIPHLATIGLPPRDCRYAPPFEGRDRLGGTNGTYGAWMRVNGHYLNVPESHGGVIRLIGWCHTFGEMIPPREFAKSHPEYFAEVDGKRGVWEDRNGFPQLCLSNPEVRRILREKTLERLRSEKNPRIISVSQNDSWGAMAENYCRCEKCAALDQAEGSPMASVLSVVNEVADAVKKEFPGVLVETIAYHYTRRPPATLRPRENVIIRFCTRNNFLYPWDSGENAAGRDEFLAWSRIAPKLYVWNYTANFGNTMMPHPSLRNYAADLRFMAANNVIAVLEQGYGRGLTGDLLPLHNYLLCKLMWNPQLDQEKLIDEFLTGYYGAAAPAVREYMDASWELFRRRALKLGGSMIEKEALPLADLLELKRIFDRAEQLVQSDPARLLRVRTAAMVVDLPILHSAEAAYENRETPAGRELRSRLDLPALVRKTAETYRKLDCRDFYRENGRLSIDSYIDTAAKRVTGDWSGGRPAPDICRDVRPEDWRRFGPESFVSWECTRKQEDGATVLEFPTRKNNWLVHWNYRPEFGLDGEWRVFVALRTETAVRNGNALMIGSSGFGQRPVRIDECRGKQFRWIDFGVQNFKGGGRLVFAPSGIDQKLEIREIVLVRENRSK